MLYVTSIPLHGINEFHRCCVRFHAFHFSLNLKSAYLIVVYTITCTPIYAKTAIQWKVMKIYLGWFVVYCTFPNIHSTPFGFFNSTQPTVPNKMVIIWKKLPSLYHHVEQLSWSSKSIHAETCTAYTNFRAIPRSV